MGAPDARISWVHNAGCSRRLFFGFLMLLAGAPAADSDPDSRMVPRVPGPFNAPGSPIQFGQLFDKGIPDDLIEHGRGIVWNSPQVIPGVINIYYSPAYRLFGKPPAHYASWIEWLYANHPDWIVYRDDGVTVAYEFANTKYPPFDIANEAAVSYYLDAVGNAAKGHQAVGFDNVSVGNAWGASVVYANPTHILCPVGKHPSCGGTAKRIWSGATDGSDLAFANDNLNYLAAARNAFHGKGLALFCNNNESAGRNPTPLQTRAAEICDGNMDEGFVYEGCFGTRPRFFIDRTWSLIEGSSTVDAKGWWFAVVYTCGDSVADWSKAEADWTIANYLLMIGNPDRNYLSIAPRGSRDYVAYPSYLSPAIGTALEAPPAAGCAPDCRRNYSNGFVVVDPSSTESVTYDVSGSACRDIWGGRVPRGRHALPPASAVVILGCRS
jgi:hypothetical protein